MEREIPKEPQTQEEILSVLSTAIEKMQAEIARAKLGITREVEVIDFDLSTEKLSTQPFEVKFPFRSIFVLDGTPGAQINCRFDSIDDDNPAVPLTRRDSWDGGRMVSKAYFHWPAQAGATVKIAFFLQSSFRTGSLIQLQSDEIYDVVGGVQLPRSELVALRSFVSSVAHASGFTALAQVTPSPANAYQVPAGKQLRIYALRKRGTLASGGDKFQIRLAHSSTAETQTGTGIGAFADVQDAQSEFCSNEFRDEIPYYPVGYVVPSGRYPIVYVSAADLVDPVTGGEAYIWIFGYLEDEE